LPDLTQTGEVEDEGLHLLGRLDLEMGLVEGERHVERVRVTSIKEQGNALLLDRLFDEILPTLEEEFPSYWREMYVLVICSGPWPLPR
jgi:hypothetical protein